MIPSTFAQFKAGVKRRAEILRRHGLLNDRAEMGKSTYSASRKKKLDDVPEPTTVAIQAIEHEAE